MESLQQNTQLSLKQYLESFSTEQFNYLILERLTLANEIISFYAFEKKKLLSKKFLPITYFLNMDNIFIEKNNQTDADHPHPNFTIIFPSLESIDLRAPFDNYSFCQSKVFHSKSYFLKKSKFISNGKVKNKITGEGTIITLSRILFTVLFGCHPFHGREYHMNVNPEAFEESFFEKNPKFIFDLQDNPNRFINGFHENAWRLWLKLSDAQKQFWMDALSGQYNNFDDFCDSWHMCFDFKKSIARTTCGKDLNALIFNDQKVLILTNQLGYCMENDTETCRECMKEGNNGVYFSLIEALVDKETQNKKLLLYAEREIFESDIDEHREHSIVFKVVVSKKRYLLGLRYLQDAPIVVIQGENERIYRKNEVIPLSAELTIYVCGSTIFVEQNK